MATLPIGRTIFVDSVFGDDTTGQLADMGKPYKTINTAYTALSGSADYTGDTTNLFVVYVQPGTYTVDNINLLDRINFYFTEGTIIQSTDILFTGHTDVRVEITGFAQFIINGTFLSVAEKTNLRATMNRLTQAVGPATSLISIDETTQSLIYIKSQIIECQNTDLTYPHLLNINNGLTNLYMESQTIIGRGQLINIESNATPLVHIQTQNLESVVTADKPMINNSSNSGTLLIQTQNLISHSTDLAGASAVFICNSSDPAVPVADVIGTTTFEAQSAVTAGGLLKAANNVTFDPSTQANDTRTKLNFKIGTLKALMSSTTFTGNLFDLSNACGNIWIDQIMTNSDVANSSIFGLKNQTSATVKCGNIKLRNLGTSVTAQSLNMLACEGGTGGTTPTKIDFSASFIQCNGQLLNIIGACECNLDVITVEANSNATRSIINNGGTTNTDTNNVTNLKINNMIFNQLSNANAIPIINHTNGALYLTSDVFDFSGDNIVGINMTPTSNNAYIDIKSIYGTQSGLTPTSNNSLLVCQQACSLKFSYVSLTSINDTNSFFGILLTGTLSNTCRVNIDYFANNSNGDASGAFVVSNSHQLNGYIGLIQTTNGIPISCSGTSIVELITDKLITLGTSPVISILGDQNSRFILTGNSLKNGAGDAIISINAMSKVIIRVNDIVTDGGGITIENASAGQVIIDFQTMNVATYLINCDADAGSYTIKGLIANSNGVPIGGTNITTNLISFTGLSTQSTAELSAHIDQINGKTNIVLVQNTGSFDLKSSSILRDSVETIDPLLPPANQYIMAYMNGYSNIYCDDVISTNPGIPGIIVAFNGSMTGKFGRVTNVCGSTDTASHAHTLYLTTAGNVNYYASETILKSNPNASTPSATPVTGECVVFVYGKGQYTVGGYMRSGGYNVVNGVTKVNGSGEVMRIGTVVPSILRITPSTLVAGSNSQNAIMVSGQPTNLVMSPSIANKPSFGLLTSPAATSVLFVNANVV
jgi:hypothetical protein